MTVIKTARTSQVTILKVIEHAGACLRIGYCIKHSKKSYIASRTASSVSAGQTIVTAWLAYLKGSIVIEKSDA